MALYLSSSSQPSRNFSSRPKAASKFLRPMNTSWPARARHRAGSYRRARRTDRARSRQARRSPAASVDIVAPRRRRVEAGRRIVDRPRTRRARCSGRGPRAARTAAAAAESRRTTADGAARPCRARRRLPAQTSFRSSVCSLIAWQASSGVVLPEMQLCTSVEDDLVVLVGLRDLRAEHEVRVLDAVIVDRGEGQRVRHRRRPLARACTSGISQHRLAGRRAADALQHVELGVPRGGPDREDVGRALQVLRRVAVDADAADAAIAAVDQPDRRS